MKIFIAIVISAVILGIGLMHNARWKAYPNPSFSEKVQFRVKKKSGLCGFGIIGAVFSIAFGKTVIALFFVFFAIIGALQFLPAILKAKVPVGEWLLKFALIGCGDVARVLLNITLIGIPIVHRVDYAAEVGMERYLRECAEEEASRPTAKDDLKEMFEAITPTHEEPEYKPEKRVKVYRPNGYMYDSLKVNSDNTMYYDDEDGEWHRIPDRLRED